MSLLLGNPLILGGIVAGTFAVIVIIYMRGRSDGKKHEQVKQAQALEKTRKSNDASIKKAGTARRGASNRKLSDDKYNRDRK